MTEDEIVGWYHQLNGYEFEQVLGDGERQGSLACCSPWVHKESDMTERLKNNNINQQGHAQNPPSQASTVRELIKSGYTNWIYKGRGARDQIAQICWIIEKARGFQKNIYFSFIDYAKSFDCVDHNKLWSSYGTNSKF